MEGVSLVLIIRVQRKKVPLVGLVREDNKSSISEESSYIGRHKGRAIRKESLFHFEHMTYSLF